jgi:hypothetical protein
MINDKQSAEKACTDGADERKEQDKTKKTASQRNHIIIKPYFGVIFMGKEITFDMSQKEVENKLGETSRFEVVKLIKTVIERQHGGTLFYYKYTEPYEYGKEKLTHIDVPAGKGLTILYENIDILNDKDSVSKLTEYDTPTPDNGKFMNFYKLGICLGGFGKKRIPEKKLVIVFAESEIEMFKARFKSGGGTIEINIDDKIYYHVNDTKDGNTIVTDKAKNVYKITKDHKVIFIVKNMLTAMQLLKEGGNEI